MAASGQVAVRPRPAGGARGSRRGSRALPYLALLAGGALISGFTIRRGGAPFDEGLVLQAARRVTEGQMPYRDFLWAYGPAQPYVLGAWFKLLGPSLLSWRLLRVAFDAGVALEVYALVRAHVRPAVALVAWLTAACAMAEPTSPTPFPAALLLVLGALLVATRTRQVRGGWLLAGVLCALAATWRIDFGLYGVAAVGVALALRPESEARRLRGLALFGATAVGGALLVYTPFLAASGPADLWEALIGKTLRDREWWTLPFPVHYHGGFRLWPPIDLAEDLKDVLGFYVPLLLVCGAALLGAIGAWRILRLRSLPPRLAGLLVLAGGSVLYLLSRTDEFHVTPLLVVLSAAIPLALAAERGVSARASLPGRALAGALVAVLALLLAYGALNRFSALVRPPELATIHLPVANGAEAPPREARALERTVRAVHRLVPPARPIYAITRRSDLVRFNQPLIYVLTERDNPTREDYDLQTGTRAQRRIVAVLGKRHPRAIVRWTDPISVVREPNRRGKPSGSRLLDRYVAAHYRLIERDGRYDVLAPRR